jgi:hypothetical protein
LTEERDLEIQYFFTNRIALAINYKGVDNTVNMDTILAQLFKADYKSFDVNPSILRFKLRHPFESLRPSCHLSELRGHTS